MSDNIVLIHLITIINQSISYLIIIIRIKKVKIEIVQHIEKFTKTFVDKI